MPHPCAECGAPVARADAARCRSCANALHGFTPESARAALEQRRSRQIELERLADLAQEYLPELERLAAQMQTYLDATKPNAPNTPNTERGCTNED